VALTLTAYAAGAVGLFGAGTAKGIATITQLGSGINGSPFTTLVASNIGTSTTTTTIYLTSIGTYDVVLSGVFTGNNLGSVTLT
jgi:broad specificity polyphosphatase/5'/3'-nucleotidase SurE